MPTGKSPVLEPGQSTTPIRAGNDLDLERLLTYLQPHIPNLTGPLNVSQFSLGQSNPTFLLISATGEKYVVRKKPPGSLLSATAHAVEREYRVLRALGEHTKVPVPKVYHLCEDPSILGTPFYVMEFLKGRIFSDVSFPSLPQRERFALWYEAISTLALLHQVSPRAIGLEGYGRSADYYARQKRSLSKVSAAQARVVDQSSGSAVGPLPRLDDLMAWYDQNAPVDECTIVHGDYKIDNLVFHPTEPRLIGILDWELSTLGHPLSDLANLLQPFSAPSGLLPTQSTSLRDLRPLPVPHEEDLQRQYCHLTGRRWPIQGWDFAKSFAFFRLAVISQGIAARVARGQASSAQAKEYGALFRPVMALAVQFVDQSNLTSSKL
ncbi:MAG: kinase-like domain-containing protein [Piptocephalis tieghemiana]|nr:MAG: kinase-like domain-containing protein [Piptocephalis tieghemiana]